MLDIAPFALHADSADKVRPDLPQVHLKASLSTKAGEDRAQAGESL